jgi:hypothetical protein
MDANGDGNADDITKTLPEVGAGGYAGTACDPNTGDLFTAGVVKRMLK